MRAHPLVMYRGAGVTTGVHVGIRWATAPLVAVANAVPSAAVRVLDMGCGHGLVSLMLASAGHEVHAVDVDPNKVKVAQAAALRGGLALEAEQVAPGWRPRPNSYDAVVLTDVLYLMGVDEALDFLSHAAAAVRPGGRLVVKEMNDQPRWKVRLAGWQEKLSVDLFGITEGATISPVPPKPMEDVMTGSGQSVSSRRLDRWRLHPHLLLIGETPKAAL